MYDSFLSINKKFKSSVNLQYDLQNKDKISEYIPTSDLCDVLKKYINSVLKNENKATLLAGPYGKGKSYLVLMLTYFFSKHDDRDLFELVLNKIKIIDTELFYLLKEIDDKKIVLLPVVINGNNSEDLNQNFMIALKTSLENSNLQDVIPDTVFSECLSLIEKWETDIDQDLDILNKCIKKVNISLKELKTGLQNYDFASYLKFTELFECVSHGYKFNPLVGNDIGLIFENVSRKITKYGYSGIFVVFDEFGVFLDNQSGDFGNRLNKIQSFAEKCNASESNCELHLCCVTHKELKLYKKNDGTYSDEFAKIEGRFKQYRFDRSLEENYQIICSALQKKSTYKKAVSQAKKQYASVFDRLKNARIFSTGTEVDYIIENGFPFNPVSLYALVNVSEKIAQNERTLFTFISDDDVSGFNYFISNTSEGLLNLHHLYDYFEELIHNNPEYRDLYYKVETIISLLDNPIDINVIKTIAIIKLINDDIKFAANIDNVSLSLGVEYDFAKNVIDSLIARNYLKQSINNNILDFAVIADKSTNDLIETIIIQKYSKCSIADLLNEFDSKRFVVSNKYNFEYKMTRYYKAKYMDYFSLSKIRKMETLFATEECDGLVIDLVSDKDLSRAEIEEIVKKCPTNIIIRYNSIPLDNKFVYAIKQYSASKYLLAQDKISNDFKSSLSLLKNDLYAEIMNYISSYIKRSRIYSLLGEFDNITDCVYETLVNYYCSTVIINNDQINKHHISSVIEKARNIVLDGIITNKNMDLGKTSSAATILNSFNKCLEMYTEIIPFIRNWFLDNNGNKVCARSLIDKLIKAPYGMRKGVIPLFIGKAISTLSCSGSNVVDTVLFYNNTVEQDITAAGLSKMIDDPNKYYFCFERLSKEKISMCNGLVKMLNCDNNMSFTDSIKCVVSNLYSRVTNLAPVIIKTSKDDNILELSANAIIFKDLILRRDLNNYDLLIKSIPESLNVEYKNVEKEISRILEEYTSKKAFLVEKIISEVKHILGFNSETIKGSYDLWKSSYEYINDIMFEQKNKKIYKSFSTIQYNDLDAINLLIFASLGISIDDISQKKYENFIDDINNFVIYVANFDKKSTIKKSDLSENDNISISSLGNTLYANIKESIEEYGDAVSNAEKATILNKLLKELTE